MDFLDPNQAPLDPDIVSTAYIKATEVDKTIISSILSGDKSKIAYLFVYLDTDVLDALYGRTKEVPESTPFGFNSFLGDDVAVSHCIVTAFDCFDGMEAGSLLRISVLAHIIKQLSEEDYKALMEEAGRHG